MGHNLVLYTMLNWMRQWDGSKISDFWQQSRAFLWLPVFSNNNTTEVSGKVFLSTSNVVKPLGGRGSAPDPAGELTALHQTLAGGKGAGCPLSRTLPPLFSIVNFGYASVNYSIWLWLADVKRTMWGCGWSTEQTKALSEAFLISGRGGLQR